jgi:hypothetical protein
VGVQAGPPGTERPQIIDVDGCAVLDRVDSRVDQLLHVPRCGVRGDPGTGGVYGVDQLPHVTDRVGRLRPARWLVGSAQHREVAHELDPAGTGSHFRQCRWHEFLGRYRLVQLREVLASWCQEPPADHQPTIAIMDQLQRDADRTTGITHGGNPAGPGGDEIRGRRIGTQRNRLTLRVLAETQMAVRVHQPR